MADLSEPLRCSNCGHRIEGSPWAFPLADMRFDEWVRFCTEKCLDAYACRGHWTDLPVGAVLQSVHAERNIRVTSAGGGSPPFYAVEWINKNGTHDRRRNGFYGGLRLEDWRLVSRGSPRVTEGRT